MAKVVNHKEAVIELADQLGKPAARKLLISADVSASAAEKLLAGRYPSEVGPLLGAAITRAIAAAKRRAS